ncbi:hypothetical protein OEIGOIKO_08144 [Streptomyces chrestomyceticus JCM 4735]|uniref:DUF4232 domain-containing protein n=1 Tax=Streptomyces chrestomyceticus JCM 4735 TaxID=1306181 RepID=A0A7U9L3C3_9ACTN|nr:DUF4232 domain-containing protein [Streptomyces chrestomyceticus]GCD40287.1 hypothetical protein OEIGOIKO_08144 [Streptomyces chrestomyceticus JCM 4735]
MSTKPSTETSASAVRTARRRTLRVAAAALTAAAGLTLTACSGADATGTKASGQAGTDRGTAAAGSGRSGSATGEQGVGGKTEGAGKQPGSENTDRGGKAGGSGVQRCRTSGLKAAFATGEDAAPDPNADGGTTTSIVLTNTSGRTCKIGGFAGVDLKPDAGGRGWSLARSSAKHGSIVLGPGDSTDFTINLGMAKENAEGSWKPATVAVTPPNETTALTLKWPWGPLVHQDGATHPATFVNPIG